MEPKHTPMRKYILLITYAILLFLAISNLEKIVGGLLYLLGIIAPIIWGIFAAYIINLPTKFIEEKALPVLWRKSKFLDQHKRGISVSIAVLFICAFLTGVIMFVLPQLYNSILALGENIPSYINEISNFANKLSQRYDFTGITGTLWNNVINNWKEILSTATNLLTTAFPQLVNFTIGLTAGVINAVLALTISVYLLFSKERVLSIVRRLSYAILKEEYAEKFNTIASQSNKVFSCFFSGQVIQAGILGLLCFIGMSIFRMPYALLVSVIMAVTALIPYLGGYIGTIPSSFLIFMESPLMALGFVIFIMCLQQFAGNIIYPRIVGNSIGLGGLWVLVAIVIGGSLFGFVGMLVGVPVFAIVYAIIRKWTADRLKQKGLAIK